VYYVYRAQTKEKVMKNIGSRRRIGAFFLAFLLFGGAIFLSPFPCRGDFNDTRTDWVNFENNPGYVTAYTYLGQPIVDYETSSDPTNGGSAVSPDEIDLASGSPNDNPGPYDTPAYGYYNGGTEYDPDDPATMVDDFVLFRMRLSADPSFKDGFGSRHWNILVDVDNDGYKEYWVDVEGDYTNGNGYDRLQILYNNDNTQEVADPDVARVEYYQALNYEDGADYSHTRVVDTADGTGDYWLEVQVPMIGFKDLLGNQVMYPDSPVGFVFSTSASNTNPLQKDFMMDLDFLSLNDPITFGDVVKANGEPDIYFIDDALGEVDFYSVGDNIYMYVKHPAANGDSDINDIITVTVTSPVTGDDEVVTLVETGPATGVFTNLGGAGNTTSSQPTEGWIPFVTTASSVQTEDWTVTYNQGTGQWDVVGSFSGAQGSATAGTPFTSTNGDIYFTIYEDAPPDTMTVIFSTTAGDTLTSSTNPGSDDDMDLQVLSGFDIQFSYTTAQSKTYTDEAAIVGAGEPFIQFTRASGLPNTDFELTTDPSTSDKLYVTVHHSDSNNNPAVAETITVDLTGADAESITLTETGPDTGIFRNTTGLDTQVSDGVITNGDNLWEDVDGGVVTATYTYNLIPYSTTASLFYIDAAGRVFFTNGAGTVGIEQYATNQPIFVMLDDANFGDCGTPPPQVTLTNGGTDSKILNLTETAPGSGIYMNRINDLVTIASSAVVVSASSTFITDGVQAGDPFVIANGPDTGTYTVSTVDSETQITLTSALANDRTGIGFNAAPLMSATFDGAADPNDDILESNHQDTITVTYDDCNDGDLDGANDLKTDEAVYNAPPIVINEVYFNPDNDPQVVGRTAETEFFMLYNNSAVPQNITGYTVADEDGFSYTVPQLSGSDITIQPGEKVYVFLYDHDMSHLDFSNTVGPETTYYLFADTGNLGVLPSDELADPDVADPSDQLSLYDTGATIVDYVGWSATVTPSIDFQSDDSSAVIRDIWVDDSFKDVATIPDNESIVRISNGFDTDQPSDWIFQDSRAVFDAITTQVMISSFSAKSVKGRVILEWETAYENGTVGFNIYRKEKLRDSWNRVNGKLLVGLLHSPRGGFYRCEDKGAEPGRTYIYRLDEMEAFGRLVRFGPFTVTPEESPDGIPLPPSGFFKSPHRPPAASAARLEARKQSLALSGSEPERMPAISGVKPAWLNIPVVDTGYYYLDAADIASGLKLRKSRVTALIEDHGLELLHRKSRVAYRQAPGARGIYFYGRGIDSRFTDENIYRLRVGQGLKMKVVDGGRPEPLGYSQTFSRTIREEKDLTPATAFFHYQEADYWLWDFVLSGIPGEESRSFDFRADAAASFSTKATLTAHLVGVPTVSDGWGSLAVFSLNGAEIGRCFWEEGEKTCRVSFPQYLLNEGDNQLTITGELPEGEALNLIYLDSFELTYRSYFQASEDSLRFQPGYKPVVTVGGFSEDRILVLDTTRPARPRFIRNRTVDGGPGDYRVSFIPPYPGKLFTAVAHSAVKQVSEVRPVKPSNLRGHGHEVDYLIITPGELRRASMELADYRRSQGLKVKVTRLEDVINQFNSGIFNPRAVKKFLTYAYRNWRKPPRFVLLVGEGHYDHKDILDFGGNLMPPWMVGTPQGLFPSDIWLADVAGGDGVPEMAIGRLPVLTADEISDYLAKVKVYENRARHPDQKICFVADDPDYAGEFPDDSNDVAFLLPPPVSVEKIYLTQDNLDDCRTSLISGLEGGVNFVNYLGHAGPDRLAQEGLLTAADLDNLMPSLQPPVLTAMTCMVGQFAFAGYDSLSEMLILKEGGGTTAVWAPSGFSINAEAKVLDEEFYRAVFHHGRKTMGQAVKKALGKYHNIYGPHYLTLIYNLLGDPALKIQ
jgi:hypothetical protein